MEEQQWHRLIARLELLIEDYSLREVRAAVDALAQMDTKETHDD